MGPVGEPALPPSSSRRSCAPGPAFLRSCVLVPASSVLRPPPPSSLLRPRSSVLALPVQLKVHGRLEELRQPAPHRLPHEGQPAGGRAGGDCPLGGDGPVRADCESAGRAAQVRAARRPAVRERPGAHRSRAQQDPEGLRGQVEVHGRLRRAVRAGVGLSRPADRNAGRQGTRIEEARHEPGRHPAGVPRLRRAPRRRAVRRLQATCGVRRLGPSVPDDAVRVPGGHRPRAGPLRGRGARLQGQEARVLVHLRPHGAGRGRGRVRGPHVAVDLRRVQAGRP